MANFALIFIRWIKWAQHVVQGTPGVSCPAEGDCAGLPAPRAHTPVSDPDNHLDRAKWRLEPVCIHGLAAAPLQAHAAAAGAPAALRRRLHSSHREQDGAPANTADGAAPFGGGREAAGAAGAAGAKLHAAPAPRGAGAAGAMPGGGGGAQGAACKARRTNATIGGLWQHV